MEMKSTIKKIMAAALAGAVLAGMAGCSTKPAGNQEGQQTGSGKTEITFLSYNLSIASQKAAAQKLIDNFNAKSDTIHVTGVPVESASMASKIQSDFVAGTTYDVAQIILNTVDYCVENYALPALEDLAGETDFQQHMEGFHPKAAALGKYSDGKTYALPYTFSTPMLYYNADLFRQAGLDPENPPKTWTEVKAAGLALKAAGKEGVHIMGTSSSDDWLIQAMIYSNGGDVLDADTKTILFGEAGAVGAISMWQDLVKSGAAANYTDTEAQEAFMAGNQGMLVTTAALESGLIAAAEAAGFELRAAAFPAFEGKEAVPVNSGSGLCVMSQDEEKAKAAWEFIKYVTSAEGYTIITSEMGYLPLRTAIVDDDQYLKGWTQEHPFVRTNLQQLDRLHKWQGYPGLNSGQIATTLVDAVVESVYTDADVQAVMTEAAAKAQDLVS